MKPMQFVIKQSLADRFFTGRDGGIPTWGDRNAAKRFAVVEASRKASELRMEGESVDLHPD
jgi:hypothetical protein